MEKGVKGGQKIRIKDEIPSSLYSQELTIVCPRCQANLGITVKETQPVNRIIVKDFA